MHIRCIDYCNSLMSGLQKNPIKKLQRVQNIAARLVFYLGNYERRIPALVTFPWLPVKYQVDLKALLIVLNEFHGKAPS